MKYEKAVIVIFRLSHIEELITRLACYYMSHIEELITRLACYYMSPFLVSIYNII